MYKILFLWHKQGNGGGSTVGKYGAGSTEREVRCGKNWMYQKNSSGNQDNFRTFVLKIFWGHEL